MSQQYIPKLSDLSKLIITNNLYSLSNDLVIFTNRIKIKTYKNVKIALDKEFLNSVIKSSIKVFIEPYNCPRYGYRLQHWIKNGYLYIYTNAYSSNNTRYSYLNLLIIGERWDTNVVNNIKKSFKNYFK